MRLFTKQEINEALAERLTPSLQKRLSAGNAAIAGLGGLGSNIAVMLARIGVGRLHLIDFDSVDLTNLNRQYYFLEDVGEKKTIALREHIRRINPYITVKTDCVKVTERNLCELFREDGIICEAFDRPDQKAMLVNGILEQFPQKTVVTASGMSGYRSSNTMVTKRVMDRWYLCGDGVAGMEEHQGLMAPRVALCAAHQANMVTRLILGEESE